MAATKPREDVAVVQTDAETWYAIEKLITKHAPELHSGVESVVIEERYGY